MKLIEYPLQLPVTNFKSKKTWTMLSCHDQQAFSAEDVARIVAICNQPLVYDFLFQDRLEHRTYQAEDAIGFLTWAEKGWREQQYFVFIVRDETGTIAAALDIKSNFLQAAEIGYWASSDSPGIMTNAVGALLQLAMRAGYLSIFGNVRATNTASQEVLKRSGFTLEKEIIEGGDPYYRYTIHLREN